MGSRLRGPDLCKVWELVGKAFIDGRVEGLATIGAEIIRTGFWGIIYYTYDKGPAHNSTGS